MRFHMQESCLSLLEGFPDCHSWPKRAIGDPEKSFEQLHTSAKTTSSIPFQNLFIWQWSWYHSHDFFRSKRKILPGSALKRVTHLLRDFKWRFSLPAGHDLYHISDPSQRWNRFPWHLTAGAHRRWNRQAAIHKAWGVFLPWVAPKTHDDNKVKVKVLVIATLVPILTLILAQILILVLIP